MIVLPAPSLRSFDALDLRAQEYTEEAIAARLGHSLTTVRRDLAAQREYWQAADTGTMLYRYGRTQGGSRRRRRVRDDEPTLPW